MERGRANRLDDRSSERNISIDNSERIAKVVVHLPHELLRPAFQQLHNLDDTLTRAPRTRRLYPSETRARKTKP